MLHNPNEPLLRREYSPNTPPALVGGGGVVGDIRLSRAAKVIEARLKTSLDPHSQWGHYISQSQSTEPVDYPRENFCRAMAFNSDSLSFDSIKRTPAS